MLFLVSFGRLYVRLWNGFGAEWNHWTGAPNPRKERACELLTVFCEQFDDLFRVVRVERIRETARGRFVHCTRLP